MPNYTVTFPAMGSTIQVWIAASEAAHSCVLSEVPRWFEDWEAMFSRFRPTSELCALNAQAGTWVQASPLFFEVATLARAASAQTDGVFNPLILNALVAAGYDHDFGRKTDNVETNAFTPGKRKPLLAVPDWQRIELDESRQAIRLPRGAQLDLGGIVKSWAAQRTADHLAALGACLVDAGGDIVARGSPDDLGGWQVQIEGAPDATYTVLLTDEAVATSGTDWRRWTRDGQTLHHLIDPRTGQPAASGVRTVSVIAADAVQSEIAAKVALINNILPDFPAILVYEDGTTTCNEEFLWRHNVEIR